MCLGGGGWIYMDRAHAVKIWGTLGICSTIQVFIIIGQNRKNRTRMVAVTMLPVHMLQI